MRAQLASVKSKLRLLVDALAQGSAAMATLREKIESLEAERAELEATEARLKSEMAAEQNEKIVADDQIRALAQFNEMVNENADNPEAIKALLPRFIDYVGFYAEEKGEGKLEVALFPDPVTRHSSSRNRLASLGDRGRPGEDTRHQTSAAKRPGRMDSGLFPESESADLVPCSSP